MVGPKTLAMLKSPNAAEQKPVVETEETPAQGPSQIEGREPYLLTSSELEPHVNAALALAAGKKSQPVTALAALGGLIRTKSSSAAFTKFQKELNALSINNINTLIKPLL